MCGIAGVAGAVTPTDHSTTRAMCKILTHRGPDDDGFYESGSVSLGMRRLAIIDVREGAQPSSNEDRTVHSVFNGEIYNFAELRERLLHAGHRIEGHGDSACIPHLYEEYGLDLFQHLRGMFAIALWDERHSRLVIARDRLGQKPLYYSISHGRLWFASELKALFAAPDISREIDPVAVDQYLTYQYVPHPRTILKGVRKLPPGHLLIWEDGSIKIEPYWQLSLSTTPYRAADELDLVEELREKFLEAVRIRMIAERPLGAFLSGGIDSSAVVAAMAKQSATPVKTFSIGFAEQAYNELPHARAVADRYSTDHHELIVEPDIAELLPAIARMFDEPFADSSAVPTFLLAKLAREHVVVALTGDGGDEAFGGYARYLQCLSAGGGRRLPPPVAAFGRRVGSLLATHSLGSARLRRYGRGLARIAVNDPADRYAATVAYFAPSESRDLYRPEFASEVSGSDPYDLTRILWNSAGYDCPLNQMLACDYGLYLPGDLLPKVDITSMAVGLEARSPFLDHHLVEFAAGLPVEMKVRGRDTKYALKRAVEPWLPDSIINRKKMGFGIPRDEWLQGPLAPLVKELLQNRHAAINQYLQADAVNSLINTHQQFGTEGPRLWALLMLELWHHEVLAT